MPSFILLTSTWGGLEYVITWLQDANVIVTQDMSHCKGFLQFLFAGQKLPQALNGAALEARNLHLRHAYDPRRGVLGHVVEEPCLLYTSRCV